MIFFKVVYIPGFPKTYTACQVLCLASRRNTYRLPCDTRGHLPPATGFANEDPHNIPVKNDSASNHLEAVIIPVTA